MPNTKNTVRQSHNFIGGIGTYGEFLKANVDMTLHNPFGTENFDSNIQMMGKTEIVHSLTGHFFEKTRSNVAMVATGSASASDGATVNQTVVAGDRYTFGSALPYTATNNQTVVQPQQFDQLMYSNGVVGTVLTAPDGSYTYTVAPNDPTKRIPAVTASDEIANLGQRTEEGSGNPEPTSYRPSRFDWKLNFKKKFFEVTDVAGAEAVYLNNGGWTFQNLSQVTEGLMTEYAAELIVGEEITNPTVLAALKEAPTGDGYIPYVKANGRVIGYDAVSGITKTDIDQWVIANAGFNAPKEYCFYGGAAPILQIQEVLKDLGGQASYASFSGSKSTKSASEIAINLNFKSIVVGNHTIHLKDLAEFNHEGMLGIKNSVYRNTVLNIPMAQSGSNNDFLTILQFEKEGGKNSLGYEEKFMSGINGNNDIRESREEYTMTIRKGLKVKGQKVHSLMSPE